MKKRYRNSKKKLYGSVFATALASTAFVPSMVWSKTADATWRGKAAANSQVPAKNVATGATRRTTASADGSYALAGLPSGTYRVDAGPGTEQTVTLSVASTATLDLVPGGAEAGPAETLEEGIVRPTRLVEGNTSEIRATVAPHHIQTNPQITPNLPAIPHNGRRTVVR